MPPDATSGTQLPITPPAVPPPAAPPVTPLAPGAETPGPVPYERFKEVNDRLRALEAAQEAKAAVDKDAADKRLAEQAQWQTLAQQREAELKAERAKALRASVALAKGLTPDLAARLQGEDEAALAADADKLLALVQAAAKGAQGPGVPPPGPGGHPVQVSVANMTPAQVREAYQKGLVK